MQDKTPHIPQQDQQAQRWLILFFGTVSALALLTVALLWIERARLPAPQLTANISFNEKMQWARGPLAEGKCDTLVLGSSMALNSLDSAELARKGYLPAANLGAWGSGVTINRRLMDIVLDLCKPKRIIMPIYYGDFGLAAGNDFDAGKLRHYLRNGVSGDPALYLRGATLADLWRDYWNLAKYRRRGANGYTNLNFDETGAAPLACDNFQRDARRWNGFTSAPVKTSPESLQALVEIVAIARALGIPFTAMETPMREAARSAFAADLTTWREQVSAIVHIGGASFIPAPANLPDDLFADYAHLNSCGARAWTQAALPPLGTP